MSSYGTTSFVPSSFLDHAWSTRNTPSHSAINYFWNIELSKSLYPCLHELEVNLRESIHQAATYHYGTDYWFDEPGVLIRNERRRVLQKREELRKSVNGIFPAYEIIENLSFGFWTSLLSAPYNSHFWMDDEADILKNAFPYAFRRELDRKQIHTRCNTIRLLRNRVFHYDNVIEGVGIAVVGNTYEIFDLSTLHNMALEMIGWISPLVLSTLRSIDMFDDVWRNGRQRITRNMI